MVDSYLRFRRDGWLITAVVIDPIPILILIALVFFSLWLAN